MIFVLTFFLRCSNDDSDVELLPDSYTLEAIIGSWAYDSVSFDGQTVLYEHTAACDKICSSFITKKANFLILKRVML